MIDAIFFLAFVCHLKIQKKGLMSMNNFKLKSKPYQTSEYTLIQYAPIEELGETQEEIDVVNYEAKCTYMGIWQNAIELSYKFKAHLEQQGIDTTFIDKEIVKVWDSVFLAYHHELIDKDDCHIIVDTEIGAKEEYMRAKENQ